MTMCVFVGTSAAAQDTGAGTDADLTQLHPALLGPRSQRLGSGVPFFTNYSDILTSIYIYIYI